MNKNKPKSALEILFALETSINTSAASQLTQMVLLLAEEKEKKTPQ